MAICILWLVPHLCIVACIAGTEWPEVHSPLTGVECVYTHVCRAVRACSLVPRTAHPGSVLRHHAQVQHARRPGLRLRNDRAGPPLHSRGTLLHVVSPAARGQSNRCKMQVSAPQSAGQSESITSVFNQLECQCQQRGSALHVPHETLHGLNFLSDNESCHEAIKANVCMCRQCACDKSLTALTRPLHAG